MTIAAVFPIILIAVLLTFFLYYWRSMAPREGTLEWISMLSRGPLCLRAKRHAMTRKDTLPLVLVTVIYAATAFFQLGSVSAPQTFAHLEQKAPLVLEFSGRVALSRMTYYSGLNTGKYTIEVSPDGIKWTEAGTVEQDTVAILKWSDFFFGGDLPETSYLRLTAHAAAGWLELGELALYNAAGERLTEFDLTLTEQTRLLFDEQDTVPAETLSWFSESYFDEIYHARTAYEHLRGVSPYELTHPPLGKLLIAGGMFLFGLNPFGWRFMGALFGVLMLPLLYVFLKNLFGKTSVALAGTVLFACNFMHLTQTRISTLDGFLVFFIIATYFFFYRYLTAEGFGKSIAPLLLSGLCFGIGVAVKWPMLYAGAGLAVLWLVNMILRWRAWESGADKPLFAHFALWTVLLSIAFFVVIPVVIYCLSYLPYVIARGEVTLHALLDTVLENQKYMFGFHSGSFSDHPYQSAWYQWIVNGRPILYFRDDTEPLRVAGVARLFAAFDNPVLSWGGLLCILAVAVQAVRRRCAKALFIVVGYIAQLLPWCFVTRPTFAYHYFPATIFLALAMCYLFNDLIERNPAGWRVPVYGLTGLSAALYAAFYPVLIGLDVPVWYNIYFLQWLPSWPLIPPL